MALRGVECDRPAPDAILRQVDPPNISPPSVESETSLYVPQRFGIKRAAPRHRTGRRREQDVSGRAPGSLDPRPDWVEDPDVRLTCTLRQLGDDLPRDGAVRIHHQDRFCMVPRVAGKLRGTASDIANARNTDILEFDRHDSALGDQVQVRALRATPGDPHVDFRMTALHGQPSSSPCAVLDVDMTMRRQGADAPDRLVR